MIVPAVQQTGRQLVVRIARFGTLVDAIEAPPTLRLDASIEIESRLRARPRVSGRARYADEREMAGIR